MRALLAVVAMAVLFALTACSSGDNGEAIDASTDRDGAANTETAIAAPEEGPFVRRCETSVYGRLDPQKWRRHAVIAGPLVFWNAPWYARQRASTFAPLSGSKRRYEGTKFLVLVRPGAVATVTVPRSERATVALLYDPEGEAPLKGYRVEDGDTAVTFEACEKGETPGTGGRLNEMTQFNGGFVVAGVQCVRLDVLVRGQPKAIPVTLSFGAGRCG
jgi:hypothetical protein